MQCTQLQAFGHGREPQSCSGAMLYLAQHIAVPNEATAGFSELCCSRSRRADGSEDAAALHAAQKVIRGKKYIATRWLQEIEE